MGSTGGHRTQDIRLAILQLRLGLYQLDHPQDKGDCKGHDHGGNTVAPCADENNEVSDGWNGGNRIQNTLKQYIATRFSLAQQKAKQDTDCHDDGGTHQNDAQCGIATIQNTREDTPTILVGPQRVFRAGSQKGLCNHDLFRIIGSSQKT